MAFLKKSIYFIQKIVLLNYTEVLKLSLKLSLETPKMRPIRIFIFLNIFFGGRGAVKRDFSHKKKVTGRHCIEVFKLTVVTRIIRTAPIRPSDLPVNGLFLNGHKSAGKNCSHSNINT